MMEVDYQEEHLDLASSRAEPRIEQKNKPKLLGKATKQKRRTRTTQID
jgi:hypothetical protein